MRLVAAIAIALAMFALPRSTYELRCFLHCHGEGAIEVRAYGVPAAYWSRDIEPGDPPLVGPGRFDPVALILDVLAFWLVLCGVAIASAALHRPARLELRTRLPRAKVIGDAAARCEPPRAPTDS